MSEIVMVDYGDKDIQELRDICGSREIRYPSCSSKDELIWMLEDCDAWDEINIDIFDEGFEPGYIAGTGCDPMVP